MGELRKTYGDQFQKKHNLKLGFMSAFVKAAAYALQDQPVVNASNNPNLLYLSKYDNNNRSKFKRLRAMKSSTEITLT